MNYEEGFCQCGCGQRTKIASFNTSLTKRGEWLKFIKGHNMVGTNNHRWKERVVDKRGYVFISNPGHLRSDSKGYVREHILKAEKVFGGPLPGNAVVHHIDENPSNNEPSNLVICQDETYHKLLHKRMRAFKRRKELSTVADMALAID